MTKRRSQTSLRQNTVRRDRAAVQAQLLAQKVGAGWSPNMEKRSSLDDGRQVKCLIASAGHLWMRHYFDRLPPAVRGRLRESPFNICPACMDEEARRIAAQPTVATYFGVIAAIERKLRVIG
jgi:hypothetical protein